MTRRSTPARRTEIMALLEERGEISVEALARYFSTSEVTISRCLADVITRLTKAAFL